ncbi:MAG TPA: T9SS type A sorting domain-containing protein [Paludibacter sp.]
MKKIILSLLLITISLNGFSITWSIANSGFSFSPATLTINQGDDVNYVIASSHNAVEVSQAVWNANGNTSSNGFLVPFGGGIVSAAQLTVGTHYYVCTPHASLGMKGKIIVQAPAGFEENKTQTDILIYPNPVIDHLNVQYNSLETNVLEIKLFDLEGKMLKVLFAKTLVAGPFMKSYDLSTETQPGVYFVQIVLGEKISFKKVVVL